MIPRALRDGYRVGWGLMAVILVIYMAMVAISGIVVSRLRKLWWKS